ncbi:Ig-like domain-containing protein [Agromyces sp. MMS24-K17]|uniref:Ig-like domain-containing protein n=1 Tax=Agromyces sp. MMS24-K17 TaxID=3372850 RepID=UPI0037552A4E
MRYPLTTPAEDVRRHPRSVRSRLAALALAAGVVGAAVATPLVAHADEATAPDAVVQDAPVAEAPAAETASDPTAEPVGAEAESSEVGEGASDAPAEDATDGDGAADAEDAAAEDAAAEQADAAGSGAVGEAAAQRGGGEASAPAAKGVAAGSADLAGADAGLPIANDDHYEMVEGTTLVVDAPDVRANDVNPLGGFWQVDDGTAPTVGTRSWSTNGFTYTAPVGFVGTASFTYVLRNAAGRSEWATVTIDVRPAGTEVLLPPIAENDAYWYQLSTPLFIAATGIVANDDVKGLAGTVSIAYASPQIGTVELAPDGGFLFTPVPDTGGSQWFRYRLCTSAGCAEAEVTLALAATGQDPSGPSAPPSGEEPGDPTEPTEPTDPADPADPADPTDPTEPTGDPGDDSTTTTATATATGGDEPADGPTPDPGSTPAAVPTSTVREETAALADTGPEASAPLVVALGALALGVLVRLAGRRRIAGRAAR